MDIVSRRIRGLREDRDLKQGEMGSLLGLSQSMVSNYENGREVPPSVIIKYADFFAVSADYLLGIANDPRPTSVNETQAYGDLARLCDAAGGKPFTSTDTLALIARFTAYYKAGAPAANAPMECFTAYMAAMGDVLDAAISGSTADLLDKTNAAASCGLQISDVLKRFLELEKTEK